MDRRELLKQLACIGGLSLLPRLSVAVSKTAGNGKNLVVINLFGGCDGLSMVPYLQGTAADRIATYRPQLKIAPESVIQVGAQNGLPYRIGLHPAFSNLASAAAGNIALIQRYGLINNSDRSHDISQLLVSLGSNELHYDSDRGFLARVMDNQNWESLQYWGLSGSALADFNTRGERPILLTDLSDFDYSRLYMEGSGDANQTAATVQALKATESGLVGIQGAYAKLSSRVRERVGVVKRDIVNQQVSSAFSGDMGSSFADATRILAAKKLSPALGQQNKSTIVYIGMGGYDTHSDQASPADFSKGLGYNFKDLGDNLAIFVSEMRRLDTWKDTVVLVISEFGRTVRENGFMSETVGTDHGWGNNTFVIGGDVIPQICGEPPSLAELDDEDENSISVAIDYRDIFSDALLWMGVPMSGIFPADYTRSTLGILP